MRNPTWTVNPDIDHSMTFTNDPRGCYSPSKWESDYELIWLMDPRFVPTDDQVWVLSLKPSVVKGRKYIGYVTPDVSIEYNSDIPKLDIDIDQLYPAYYELDHECVYELDPEHQPNEPMWVLKFKPNWCYPKEWKWIGTIRFTPEFELNPDLPEMEYNIDYVVPLYDFEFEHIWMLDPVHTEDAVEEIWAVKGKLVKSTIGSKIVGITSPVLQIEYNKDMPRLDYDLEVSIPYYDFGYRHMWMLDPIHTKDAVEDIWAVKVSYALHPTGTKTIGSISPVLHVEYNKNIPAVEYDLPTDIPYYDFKFEHMWMLDPAHTEDGTEDIWAVKASYALRPTGTKIVGPISPTLKIEYNKNIPAVEYDVEVKILYHDFVYRHMWILDNKHTKNAKERIWAVRASYVTKPIGTKIMGKVSPNISIEYNPELPRMNFEIEEPLQFHDFDYEHIWYLDPDLAQGDNVWAVKAKAVKIPSGIKEMGIVEPILGDLDVVFISYNEPNAEKNWQRVLEKAPWAKRVDGVEGIFNAHKEAARISTTDMFYVVDGDAYLVDEWEFDFQPNIFDRDCAYVWSSKNPINNLTYQNGGVKLFSKSILMKQKKWNTLDMFTGIMPKIKSETRVSCITTFNTDEFSTWRSAFRECVKLYNVNQMSKLNVWLTKGKTKSFGRYAIAGAEAGYKYAVNNNGNLKALTKINDYKWLRAEFNKASI